MIVSREIVYRRLTQWTLVCSISAAPSFIWAMSSYDPRAMLLGVGLFIAAYTLASCTDAFERLKARPFVRTTLYIGYGTRIALSLAFPLGMAADLYPGMISTSIVGSLVADSKGFVGTLLTTIVQGTLLNLLLSVYMVIVYGLQRLTRQAPPPPEGSCVSCGYNLTGNVSGVCPECGSSIAATVQVPPPYS